MLPLQFRCDRRVRSPGHSPGRQTTRPPFGGLSEVNPRPRPWQRSCSCLLVEREDGFGVNGVARLSHLSTHRALPNESRVATGWRFLKRKSRPKGGFFKLMLKYQHLSWLRG
jgi:hypothetical protein